MLDDGDDDFFHLDGDLPPGVVLKQRDLGLGGVRGGTIEQAHDVAVGQDVATVRRYDAATAEEALLVVRCNAILRLCDQR
jgi:hypothetical protein